MGCCNSPQQESQASGQKVKRAHTLDMVSQPPEEEVRLEHKAGIELVKDTELLDAAPSEPESESGSSDSDHDVPD